MKVNITVGARFNAGITASALCRNDVDVAIYTSSPPNKWQDAKSKVKFTPLLLRIVGEILGRKLSRSQRELDTRLFDFFVSLRMRECQILHGWATFSLITARKHLKGGGVFLLDRACPHAAFQQELLLEESDILEQEFAKFSPTFMERMLEEYELANAILVPSAYTLNSFINKGVNPDKLKILRLDANISPKQPRIRNSSQDKTFVVGSVGGNIVRKGFLYLIRAWQKLKLPNAKLLIKTSQKELDKITLLRKLVESDPSIEIIGYVEDIESFYDKCDVFCLPSIDDGFGMVVLEAMACGLPVITTTNVGASEFVQSGNNGYMTPIRDEDALANHIHQFYTDRSLVNQMSLNAMDAYKAIEKSTDNYEKNLLDIYRQYV